MLGKKGNFWHLGGHVPFGPPQIRLWSETMAETCNNNSCVEGGQRSDITSITSHETTLLTANHFRKKVAYISYITN